MSVSKKNFLNPPGSKNKSSRRIPSCHPDRPHRAFGKCDQCYDAAYSKQWFAVNKENKNSDNMANHVKNSKRDASYCRKMCLKKYGLSIDEYIKLGELQNWLCGICGHPETAVRGGKVIALAVDHDHDKKLGDIGFIRGLLCRECNLGIGRIKTSTNLLAASRYLQKYEDSA